jgi:predicted alpha/beta-hydrolase family hydrolase
MDTAAQDNTTELTLNSADQGGSDKFQGLLLKGTGDVGVILIHGRSKTNPDSPPVGIVRKSLNEAGYSTLSIARPDPKKGDEWEYYDEGPDYDPYTFPECYARIRTAMAELAKHGAKKVILSGHSMGARMTSAFLSEEGGEGPLPVAGFLALGIGTNGGGLVSALNTIGKVAVPVYDIYGGGDDNVSKDAAGRKAAYAAGPGSSYHQIVIGDDSTPHPLTGAEDEMIDVVNKAAQSIAPVS